MKEEKEEQKVRKFLAKHGYPLEMQVASRLQAAGYGIAHSEFYVDLETRKSREIDLVGQKNVMAASGRIQLSLQLVIECKFSRGHPWIVFSEQGTCCQKPLHIEAGTEKLGRNLLSNLTRVSDLPERGFFRGPSAGGYSATTVRDKQRNGKDAQNKNTTDWAYSALMTVTQAVQQVQAPGTIGTLFTALGEHIRIRVPVIIIDGSLFQARLDTTNDLEITQTCWARIRWKHNQLNGNGILVDLVVFSFLDDYLLQIASEIQVLVAKCEAAPALYKEESLAIKEMINTRYRSHSSDGES